MSFNDRDRQWFFSDVDASPAHPDDAWRLTGADAELAHCGTDRPDEHHASMGLETTVLQEIGQSVAGPDVTRSVMTRLGYMPVTPAVARAQRRRRWWQRSAVSLILLLALGMGWQIYDAGPASRSLEGPTLPTALSNDLQQQRQGLQHVMDVIENDPLLRFVETLGTMSEAAPAPGTDVSPPSVSEPDEDAVLRSSEWPFPLA